MPLNWNFPAKIGPKTGKQVTWPVNKSNLTIFEVSQKSAG
jgi:hypothetical protein